MDKAMWLVVLRILGIVLAEVQSVLGGPSGTAAVAAPKKSAKSAPKEEVVG